MVKLSKGTYKIIKIKKEKHNNKSNLYTVEVGCCSVESKSLALRTERFRNSPLSQEIVLLDIHVVVKMASEC